MPLDLIERSFVERLENGPERVDQADLANQIIDEISPLLESSHEK